MYAQHSAEQPPQAGGVDGLNDRSAAKTPVSLLQELCMRRGISPKYDLLQIEGAVHEPTFVYRVTVGEFTSSGSGQSKKKAKHAAAKAVLDVIIHGGGPVAAGGSHTTGGDVTVSSNGDTQQGEHLSLMVSPYDDGIPGNPVGQLQELCMTRRWPPPTYELTAEEGFPHERTFSIACTIATYKEIGGGKSKKLAKRQAAYAMLQKLREMPQEQQPGGYNEDEDDLAQKLTMRYAGLKDSKMMSLSGGDTRKVSQFHKMLKQKAGTHIKELQKVSLSATSGLNFIQMLQDIAQEGSFVTTYVDIDEKSFLGESQCLLQLSTLPIAVCYGTGSTCEEAQSSAAHNALEYLKIMTKMRS